MLCSCANEEQALREVGDFYAVVDSKQEHYFGSNDTARLAVNQSRIFLNEALQDTALWRYYPKHFMLEQDSLIRDLFSEEDRAKRLQQKIKDVTNQYAHIHTSLEQMPSMMHNGELSASDVMDSVKYYKVELNKIDEQLAILKDSTRNNIRFYKGTHGLFKFMSDTARKGLLAKHYPNIKITSPE